ncbi:MAG: hypothetical protein BWX68_02366 [Verrucomicrobia bacterium ADurb.Bin063]|nr:MAG: hypothetical protein BWX68_02366 [Verrucomicrobia bacterium ADurb.Bin063]
MPAAATMGTCGAVNASMLLGTWKAMVVPMGTVGPSRSLNSGSVSSSIGPGNSIPGGGIIGSSTNPCTSSGPGSVGRDTSTRTIRSIPARPA